MSTKLYHTQILTLQDGSQFVTARTDDRTPEQLNIRANSDYVSFEVWMAIRKHPVLTVESIGDGTNKQSALIRKQAMIDLLKARGVKVRNNPKNGGLNYDELAEAEAVFGAA
jgi:hypothetical protein